MDPPGACHGPVRNKAACISGCICTTAYLWPKWCQAAGQWSHSFPLLSKLTEVGLGSLVNSAFLMDIFRGDDRLIVSIPGWAVREKLWKLTFLLLQGKKAELKSFIIELSKEFSILSQFTSFVAIEERVCQISLFHIYSLFSILLAFLSNIYLTDLIFRTQSNHSLVLQTSPSWLQRKMWTSFPTLTGFLPRMMKT